MHPSESRHAGTAWRARCRRGAVNWLDGRERVAAWPPLQRGSPVTLDTPMTSQEPAMRPLPPRTLSRSRELDACGIGFVADAHGRPSRAIVQAALDGLASVMHRGALAADARSSDGSGLLIPIPEALFGPDHGVVNLFARSGDPRAAIEDLAAEEGLTVDGWREPPTDDDHLGDRARGSRPRMLQGVLSAPA